MRANIATLKPSPSPALDFPSTPHRTHAYPASTRSVVQLVQLSPHCLTAASPSAAAPGAVGPSTPSASPPAVPSPSAPLASPPAPPNLVVVAPVNVALTPQTCSRNCRSRGCLRRRWARQTHNCYHPCSLHPPFHADAPNPGPNAPTASSAAPYARNRTIFHELAHLPRGINPSHRLWVGSSQEDPVSGRSDETALGTAGPLLVRGQSYYTDHYRLYHYN